MPEEVVSEVTVPVEDVIWERFKGQGLKHISSTSASGVSVIFITFDYGTNMGDTNRFIEEAIDGISLPDEVRQLESNPQIIRLLQRINSYRLLHKLREYTLRKLKVVIRRGLSSLPILSI